MNTLSNFGFRFLAAAVVFGLGLCAGDTVRISASTGIFATAEARIGRPMTPMSYAGVARRTTRRAVAVGTGAAVAGTYYGSTCVQRVDAYGRLYTAC
jgi:hypothetical protein